MNHLIQIYFYSDIFEQASLSLSHILSYSKSCRSLIQCLLKLLKSMEAQRQRQRRRQDRIDKILFLQEYIIQYQQIVDQMQEINFVYVFEVPSRVYSLLLISPSQLILCTQSALYLYNPSTLQYTHYLTFSSKVSPISIHQLKDNQYLIQTKEGTLILFQKNQNKLSITKILSTSILGFTKVKVIGDTTKHTNILYFNDQSRTLNIYNLESESQREMSVDDITNVTCLQVIPHNQEYHIYVFTEGIKIYKFSFHADLEYPSLSLINTWETKGQGQNQCQYLIETSQHQSKIYGIIRKVGILQLDTLTNNLQVTKMNKLEYRRMITKDRVYLISNKIVRSNYSNLKEEVPIALVGKATVTDAVLDHGLLVSAFENGLVAVVSINH